MNEFKWIHLLQTYQVMNVFIEILHLIHLDIFSEVN